MPSFSGVTGRSPSELYRSLTETHGEPAYSRLDTTRFQHDFGLHLGDWREGLDDVLDALADPARTR